MSDFDQVVDVVVVGSGSGGMVAALTAHDHGAETLMLEKSDKFGGTSATSGHGVWIPCNRYALAAGAEDSLEEAEKYIKAVTPLDKVPESLIDCYVEQGPRMIDYLYDNTHCHFDNHPTFPDYFSFAEGSKAGNRSMEPKPMFAKELKGEFDKMQPLHQQVSIYGRINVTQREGQWLLGRQQGWLWKSVKMVARYWLDFPARIKGKRDHRLTAGQAGVGSLRVSMLERNIPLQTGCDVRELITNEEGRVTGLKYISAR